MAKGESFNHEFVDHQCVVRIMSLAGVASTRHNPTDRMVESRILHDPFFLNHIMAPGHLKFFQLSSFFILKGP